jgi:hypothetical protein
MDFPTKSGTQQGEESFNQEMYLKFQGTGSEMLHLGHCSLWRRNLGTSKITHKSLGNFEMWCSRRMEIILTDRVKNEVLQRSREKRSYIQ